MSFSPSAERIARRLIAASECGPVTTSSKARSADSFQCQVSSKASICACDPSPEGASSLYGRGLAKLKKGDRAAADADVAAAKVIKADIAEELARYGIK
jgi:hypothetical protein